MSSGVVSISLELDRSQFDSDLQNLSRENPKLQADLSLNSDQFRQELDQIAKGQPLSVQVALDSSRFERDLDEVLQDRQLRIEAILDTKELEKQLQEFQGSVSVGTSGQGAGEASGKAVAQFSDAADGLKDSIGSLGKSFRQSLSTTQDGIREILRSSTATQGTLGAITAPLRSVSRGFFEGIGQGFSRSFAVKAVQSLEEKLGVSMKKLGTQFGSILAGVVDKNVGRAARGEKPTKTQQKEEVKVVTTQVDTSINEFIDSLKKSASTFRETIKSVDKVQQPFEDLRQQTERVAKGFKSLADLGGKRREQPQPPTTEQARKKQETPTPQQSEKESRVGFLKGDLSKLSRGEAKTQFIGAREQFRGRLELAKQNPDPNARTSELSKIAEDLRKFRTLLNADLNDPTISKEVKSSLAQSIRGEIATPKPGDSALTKLERQTAESLTRSQFSTSPRGETSLERESLERTIGLQKADPSLQTQGKSLQEDQKRAIQNFLTIFNRIVQDAGLDPGKVRIPALKQGTPRGSSGEYNPTRNELSLNPKTFSSLAQGRPKPQDIDTIAHEVGHAIQFGFGQVGLEDIGKGKTNKLNPLTPVSESDRRGASIQALNSTNAFEQSRAKAGIPTTPVQRAEVEKLEFDAAVFGKQFSEAFAKNPSPGLLKASGINPIAPPAPPAFPKSQRQLTSHSNQGQSPDLGKIEQDLNRFRGQVGDITGANQFGDKRKATFEQVKESFRLVKELQEAEKAIQKALNQGGALGDERDALLGRRSDLRRLRSEAETLQNQVRSNFKASRSVAGTRLGNNAPPIPGNQRRSQLPTQEIEDASIKKLESQLGKILNKDTGKSFGETVGGKEDPVEKARREVAEKRVKQLEKELRNLPKTKEDLNNRIGRLKGLLAKTQSPSQQGNILREIKKLEERVSKTEEQTILGQINRLKAVGDPTVSRNSSIEKLQTLEKELQKKEAQLARRAASSISKNAQKTNIRSEIRGLETQRTLNIGSSDKDIDAVRKEIQKGILKEVEQYRKALQKIDPNTPNAAGRRKVVQQLITNARQRYNKATQDAERFKQADTEQRKAIQQAIANQIKARQAQIEAIGGESENVARRLAQRQAQVRGLRERTQRIIDRSRRKRGDVRDEGELARIRNRASQENRGAGIRRGLGSIVEFTNVAAQNATKGRRGLRAIRDSFQDVIKTFRDIDRTSRRAKRLEDQISARKPFSREFFERFFRGIGAGVQRSSALKGVAPQQRRNLVGDAGGFIFSAAALSAPIATISAGLAPLLPAVAPLIATFGLLNNILKPFAQSVIRVIKIIEPLERRFTIVSGSKEAGQATANFVQSTAEDLNIPLQTSLEEFSKLQAAAKGSKLEGQGVKDLYIGIASAVKAMGLSAEDARLVFFAFTQQLSKGKLSAEEIRQQLGERFPPAVRVYAEALGVTTSEFNKLLESGSLLSDEVLPKVGKALQDEFGDAARNAGASFTGSINQIQNEFFKLQKSVAESFQGVFTVVAGTVARTTAFVAQNINGIVKIIGIALIGITAQFAVGLQAILSTPKIATAVAALSNGMSVAFASAFATLTPFFVGIVVDFLDDVFGADTSVFDNMAQGIYNAAVAIFTVLDDISRAISGNKLFNPDPRSGEGTVSLLGQIGSALKFVRDLIPSALVEFTALFLMFTQLGALANLFLVPVLKNVALSIKATANAMITAIAQGGGLKAVFSTLTAGAAASTLALNALLAVLVLFFANADFSSTLEPTIDKATSGILESIYAVEDALAGLGDKGEKTGDRLAKGLTKGLPSKGFNINPGSFFGGEPIRTDDVVKSTRATGDTFRGNISSNVLTALSNPIRQLGRGGQNKKLIELTDNFSEEELQKLFPSADLTIGESKFLDELTDVTKLSESLQQSLDSGFLTTNINNGQLKGYLDLIRNIDKEVLRLRKRRVDLSLEDPDANKAEIADIDAQVATKLKDRAGIVSGDLTEQIAETESALTELREQQEFLLFDPEKNKDALEQIASDIEQKEARLNIIAPLEGVNLNDAVSQTKAQLEQALALRRDILANEDYGTDYKQALVNALEPGIKAAQEQLRILEETGAPDLLTPLEEKFKDLQVEIAKANKDLANFKSELELEDANIELDILTQKNKGKLGSDDAEVAQAEAERASLEKNLAYLEDYFEQQQRIYRELLAIPNPGEDVRKETEEARQAVIKTELELAQSRIKIAQATAKERKAIEEEALNDIKNANERASAIIGKRESNDVASIIRQRFTGSVGENAASFSIDQIRNEATGKQARAEVQAARSTISELKKLRANRVITVKEFNKRELEANQQLADANLKVLEAELSEWERAWQERVATAERGFNQLRNLSERESSKVNQELLASQIQGFTSSEDASAFALYNQSDKIARDIGIKQSELADNELLLNSGNAPNPDELRERNAQLLLELDQLNEEFLQTQLNIQDSNASRANNAVTTFGDRLRQGAEKSFTDTIQFIKELGFSGELIPEQVSFLESAATTAQTSEQLNTKQQEIDYLDQLNDEGFFTEKEYRERRLALISEYDQLENQLIDNQMAQRESQLNLQTAILEENLAQTAAIYDKGLADLTENLKRQQLSGRLIEEEVTLRVSQEELVVTGAQVDAKKTEIAEIERLNQLGLLSEQEFVKKRRELVAELDQLEIQSLDQQLEIRERRIDLIKAIIEKGSEDLQLAEKKAITEIKKSQLARVIDSQEAEQRILAIESKSLAERLARSQDLIANERRVLQERLALAESGGEAEREILLELAELELQLTESQLDADKKLLDFKIKILEDEIGVRNELSSVASDALTLEKEKTEELIGSLQNALDLTKARLDLQKSRDALKDFGSEAQVKTLERVIELRKKLKDKSLSSEERREVRSELNALPFRGASVDSLERRLEQEKEKSQERQLLNLQKQQKVERDLLALENERKIVAAEIAQQEAQIAKFKSQQAFLQSILELQKALQSGDQRRVQIAAIGVKVAKEQVKLSNLQARNAQKNVSTAQELAYLENQRTRNEQQLERNRQQFDAKLENPSGSNGVIDGSLFERIFKGILAIPQILSPKIGNRGNNINASGESDNSGSGVSGIFPELLPLLAGMADFSSVFARLAQIDQLRTETLPGVPKDPSLTSLTQGLQSKPAYTDELTGEVNGRLVDVLTDGLPILRDDASLGNELRLLREQMAQQKGGVYIERAEYNNTFERNNEGQLLEKVRRIQNEQLVDLFSNL